MFLYIPQKNNKKRIFANRVLTPKKPKEHSTYLSEPGLVNPDGDLVLLSVPFTAGEVNLRALDVADVVPETLDLDVVVVDLRGILLGVVSSEINTEEKLKARNTQMTRKNRLDSKLKMVY